MTDEEREGLAIALVTAREARGLSVREVARRSGIDVGVISRLERQLISQPRHETVRAVAQVVGLSLGDVYALLHWLPADELPTIKPYMRAKYADLPDTALAEVEEFIEQLASKYNTGPIGHEDEQ